MKSIGVLSDTHSSLHPRAYEFFEKCDELWHAGDVGNLKTAEDLARFKPLRAVYGNIDGNDIRSVYPETLLFFCEEVKVLITHIGGYPGHFDPRVLRLIRQEKPQLFISGHSHILKVIYDKKNQLLHINPGAAGNSGFHHSITMVRFMIDGKNIRDLDVLDIPRR